MKKTVFICRGNIFRSQIAKAIYNFKKSENSIAVAYGTNVGKQGNEGLLLSKYPRLSGVISIMKKHGMDISNEHCTQLLPEHLIDVSKIILMTEKEDIPQWLQKYGYEYWEIPNPESATDNEIESIISLLENKISKIL